MMLFLSKLYWKLFGWKIVGTLPKDHKKMILVVAPHTSWKDLFIGFAARHALKIPHGKFLGKKELFEGFLGRFLRNLGGIPVDRSAKLGIVEQVVRYFQENEEFIVGLSPEGTRKRVSALKTGFYHISKNAHVPMVLLGFNYKNKQVVVGETFYASESEEADFKKIIAFFSTIVGANPANDLTHLREME